MTNPPAGNQTNYSWHSRTVCREAEGSDYGWRWNINLTRNGSAVTENIFFHAYPCFSGKPVIKIFFQTGDPQQKKGLNKKC